MPGPWENTNLLTFFIGLETSPNREGLTARLETNSYKEENKVHNSIFNRRSYRS